MRENIVIADTHGVRKEFNQLLKKIGYHADKHRLIMLGDFLDRGPDPVGLIHQIQDLQIESVVGNHEEKAIRWRKHEAIRELTGTPNPMRDPVPSRKKEWESLTKSDLKWIASLPVTIKINDSWLACHGGLSAARSVEDQIPDHVIRMRYVDKDTLEYKPAKNKEQPKNSVFWAEVWDKPVNVVFGHTRFEKPKVFQNKNNVCIGLDTSCVYGGELTAYNIDKNEFTSVKAERKYYP